MQLLKSKVTYVIAIILASLIILAMWQYKHRFTALANNPTILMVFNGEYYTEAENSLASIKKHAPELIPNLTICVSDESSRNFAQRHNLRSFELSTITETGSYLSKPMNIMGRRKIECIMALLQQGEDVFYLDTDIVFKGNPIKEFNAAYDLNIQADECFRPYTYNYLCTGFMYIKPNKRTISFFQEIIDEVVSQDYLINDQNALDLLVKTKGLLKFYNLRGLKINVLDVCKFPNGCRYFDKSDKHCKAEDALIIHNNHIVGIQNKRARFEKHGLIFADAEVNQNING